MISNGNGIYLTQAIRMASWKPSSSPSDKVSMLHARIRPLQRNNGEHFSRRQRTSSTDALCIQVLTTSGKLHLSHRMILLLVSIFRHLNQNLRKGSTPDRLRSTQDRVNEFWKCWMRYFAPNLLPRNKWFRTRENIQVDDLVLEVDPNHKRSKWKLARVIATYPGNDGLVRKARIKTQDSEYDRPIHKLCLIATKNELNADRSS